MSKRTAYEKHYDNHDGTTTALIHSTPLHYLDDGEWRDINNTLMPGQDNNYVNTSNSITTIKTASDSAYISEENPNVRYTDNFLKIGGSYGNRFESFISFPVNYANFSNTAEIKEATCSLMFLSHGSCKQVGHSIDCSTWSHKRGTGPIENANNTLCDETISTKALSLIPVGDYGTMCDQVRYYTITKDAFLYNSWHGNGHASTSTGTPYRPQ